MPVEELTQEDVEQFLFIEGLEDLTQEWPEAFVIHPSERVRAYLEER